MKVLWFTSTPCSAAEKLGANIYRGGWQKSLEQELTRHADIDLSICFYAGTEVQPFNYKGASYYPVYRKSSGSKISRYLKRISGKLNNSSLELRQLLHVIDQVKPDIIHVHGTEDNFGLIQELTKLPVVISIQGILTPYIEKFYAGVPSATAHKHESLTEKIGFKSAHLLHKKMRAKVERERIIFKQSKFVIGRTDWDRRVSKVLAPDSRYFYNSEILRAGFYEAKRNKTAFNDRFTIVTVSSGGLYKGFETIVQTAKILQADTHLNFQWIVVGLNENSGIVKLVKNWMKVNLPGIGINLLGSKSETEVLQVLSAADVYCQVSHIENSPNSLCEAMLTGMPVIASYAGGTSSLIENGLDGILVQDGDPYVMAGAILELAHDFKKAMACGVNARKKALQRHDRKSITDDLVTIYKTIIGETEPVKLKIKTAAVNLSSTLSESIH